MTMTVGMVMIGMRGGFTGDSMCLRKRRRHYARELGDQKQGDQYVNGTFYCPEPLH